MSAKGTTWKKSDKQRFQDKEPKLPEWVHNLLDTLMMEINMLKEENKKLKQKK